MNLTFYEKKKVISPVVFSLSAWKKMISRVDLYETRTSKRYMLRIYWQNKMLTGLAIVNFIKFFLKIIAYLCVINGFCQNLNFKRV